MNRENPFADLYKLCNMGRTNQEKNELRNKMQEPLLIDVELTNVCNLQCYMCPTGTNSMVRCRGFMSEEVMSKLLENLSKSTVRGIRLILWGEPTLHPCFLEFAAKIKQMGKLLHFNTNGILLTEGMMQELIDMEADSIKFSFQGVDRESYEEMRFGSDWDIIMEHIKSFAMIRKKNEKPYIHISTTVTDESKERIDRFVYQMQAFCDEVTVGQTILSHLDVCKMNITKERKEKFINLKNRQSLAEKHLDVCPEIYNKLSVLWNGDVTMCCNDYDGKDMVLGNILNASICDLWRSEKAVAICEKLCKGDYDQFGICSTCYEYIPLES